MASNEIVPTTPDPSESPLEGDVLPKKQVPGRQGQPLRVDPDAAAILKSVGAGPPEDVEYMGSQPGIGAAPYVEGEVTSVHDTPPPSPELPGGQPPAGQE